MNFFEYTQLYPEIFLFTLSLLFFSFYLIPQKRNFLYFAGFLSFCFIIFGVVFFSLIYFKDYSLRFLLRGQLVIDTLSFYFKLIAIFSVLVYVSLTVTQLRQRALITFEFYFFLFLVLLSIFFLASSYDFLTLYVAIELQSLILYIFATRERYTFTSTEAGLKYFIVGGFASALLLFGITLIYGYTGSTSFLDISKYLVALDDSNSLLLGLFFIFVALFFKLGLAPFHMWIPDVYEGSPITSTVFFATVSKIGLLAVFVRLSFTVFFDIFFIFQGFFNFVGLLSLVIGSLGALYQNNLKRLFAYSGISHMGFIILGLSSNSFFGLNSVLFYLLIYLCLSFSVFGVILLTINKSNQSLETLEDLSSLLKSDPSLSFIFLLSLFSLAGIPPLAGFFNKFYVLLNLIESGFLLSSVIAILMSVISSFYYIRLIKILYFEYSQSILFQFNIPAISSIFLGYLSAFNILFFIFPNPFLSWISLTVNYFFIY